MKLPKLFTVALILTATLNFCLVKVDASAISVSEAIAHDELEKMLKIVPETSFWTSTDMTSVRSKYPNLYASVNTSTITPSKTVFLTFDDGPSKVTEKVLDVLKKHDAKATFFVVGTAVKKHPETLKRIIKEGHAIGLHTNTHKYQTIYSSVDAYLNDINECLNSIKEVTKSPVNIVRFPGGSKSMYNRINKKIQSELARRNFVYFDWNIDSGDAKTRGASSARTANNVLRKAGKYDMPVILMHDEASKRSTPEAVDLIVSELKKQGYKFDSLSNRIDPVQFQKAK